MTEAEFHHMVRELIKGNNEVLKVLQPFQAYCQKTLMIKSRNSCSATESYDIFIDAMLDFRKNALAGKVRYKAIRAYLAQICWNKWMEKSRRKQRQASRQQGVRRELYPQEKTADPETIWVEREKAEAIQQARSQQVGRVYEVMKSLSEKCQKLLRMAIIDEMPMVEIAKALGFKNARVAKTSKSRCYKKLMLKIKGA